jgi:hypothetical protein
VNNFGRAANKVVQLIKEDNTVLVRGKWRKEGRKEEERKKEGGERREERGGRREEEVEVGEDVWQPTRCTTQLRKTLRC